MLARLRAKPRLRGCRLPGRDCSARVASPTSAQTIRGVACKNWPYSRQFWPRSELTPTRALRDEASHSQANGTDCGAGRVSGRELASRRDHDPWARLGADDQEHAL